MLLGHTEGTTTGRYGILPQGELTHRQRMIEAINYPGLTLAGGDRGKRVTHRGKRGLIA